MNIVPSTWSLIKIGEANIEIIDGDRGKNYPKSNELLDSGYCPFFNNKNIIGDKINLDEVSYITKEKDEKLRKGKAYLDDIILTTRGSVGNVGIMHKDLGIEFARINSGMVIFRNKTDLIDTQFLYYLLKSPYVKSQFKQFSTGSAQPQLPIRDIKNIKLIIPPKEQQMQIVSILKGIEDMININFETNKTLEQIAMNIYKHWFVDFGPFQDGEFVESEIGLIPKDWEVHSIYDLADYINGKAFKTKDLHENGQLPVIKIAELKSGIGGNTKFYNGEYKEKHVIIDGDVLFAWSASLGVYLWSKGKALLNQHIFNVQPKEGSSIGKPFIYFMLKRLIEKFINIAASRATTMGHITKEHLVNEKIALPPSNLMSEIQEKLEIYYQQILSNSLGIEKLIQTRDYLLPKLISGEVNLIEAKESVGNEMK